MAKEQRDGEGVGVGRVVKGREVLYGYSISSRRPFFPSWFGGRTFAALEVAWR